ncbi:MAG TPA: TAXI family TRAP transporter solute-binding subunit [Xanthobacteraceae bacterium]|nr:TAXI family TRAP transporter solute-binding subunit [Xanthobacteraceae bacterium]
MWSLRVAAVVLLALPLASASSISAPRPRTNQTQQPAPPATQKPTPPTVQKPATPAMQKTTLVLGTATPGGGFPLFGDALAAAVNETDSVFHLETRNTKGSAENIPLLESSKLDIALVAGEPAYEAFAGIGRPITNIKIITAIYSSPGMFAVKPGSSYQSVQSLLGQPIVWGTRDSGLTLLGRYVMDGLGLDRDKDFQAIYLDRAGDGPAMVLDGRAAALWGAGVGWPSFTAVTQAGGHLIGLSAAEIARVRKKHNFLKPLTLPAGTYPNQSEIVTSVGSWSFVVARPSLDDDTAYHLAKAIHRSYDALVKRVAQGHETTPQNTVAAAPRLVNIHPGVQKYLREIGIIR